MSLVLCKLQGGLIIEEIFDEGNAYRDGRLCSGDRIIAVDDDDITGLDLAEATLLLSTPVPLIKLTVVRNGGEKLSLSLSLSLSCVLQNFMHTKIVLFPQLILS